MILKFGSPWGDAKHTFTKVDVLPKDKNVFSGETLAAVREMTDRLWQTPFFSRVDSITNFQWTRSDGDDVIIVSDLNNRKESHAN